MGPERVMQNSEGDLGEDERPADGAQLPVWNGGEEGEEGADIELDGEEEEEGEEQNGGYYYQPLNQEPGEDGDDRGELQDVQSRIQVSSIELRPTWVVGRFLAGVSPAGDGAPPS